MLKKNENETENESIYVRFWSSLFYFDSISVLKLDNRTVEKLFKAYFEKPLVIWPAWDEFPKWCSKYSNTFTSVDLSSYRWQKPFSWSVKDAEWYAFRTKLEIFQIWANGVSKLKNLQCLIMKSNNICSETLKCFLGHLKLPLDKLREFDISDNPIGDEGLALYLRGNLKVEKLHFDSCEVTSAGLNVLGTFLLRNKTVKSLDLNYNLFTQDDMNAFIEKYLVRNWQVTSIWLHHLASLESLSKGIERKIEAICERNKLLDLETDYIRDYIRKRNLFLKTREVNEKGRIAQFLSLNKCVFSDRKKAVIQYRKRMHGSQFCTILGEYDFESFCFEGLVVIVHGYYSQYRFHNPIYEVNIGNSVNVVPLKDDVDQKSKDCETHPGNIEIRKKLDLEKKWKNLTFEGFYKNGIPKTGKEYGERFFSNLVYEGDYHKNGKRKRGIMYEYETYQYEGSADLSMGKLTNENGTIVYLGKFDENYKRNGMNQIPEGKFGLWKPIIDWDGCKWNTPQFSELNKTLTPQFAEFNTPQFTEYCHGEKVFHGTVWDLKEYRRKKGTDYERPDWVIPKDKNTTKYSFTGKYHRNGNKKEGYVELDTRTKERRWIRSRFEGKYDDNGNRVGIGLE